MSLELATPDFKFISGNMIGQGEYFDQKLLSQVNDRTVLEDNRFCEIWWSHCEDTSNSEIRNCINVTYTYYRNIYEHTIGIVFILKITTLLKAVCKATDGNLYITGRISLTGKQNKINFCLGILNSRSHLDIQVIGKLVCALESNLVSEKH